MEAAKWFVTSPMRWLKKISSNFVSFDDQDFEVVNPNLDINQSYLHPLV